MHFIQRNRNGIRSAAAREAERKARAGTRGDAYTTREVALAELTPRDPAALRVGLIRRIRAIAPKTSDRIGRSRRPGRLIPERRLARREGLRRLNGA